MKHKIAILHTAHWDQLLGGAEQQLKYLANFLLDQGHEVHFIFPKRTKDPIKGSSLHVHPLNCILVPGVLGKSWFRFKRRITKKMSSIEPTLIITRSYSSWAGIAAEYAQKKKIHHFHFVASDQDVVQNPLPRFLPRPLNRIEFKLGLKVYNEYSTVFVQSSFQKLEMKRNYQKDTIIMTQVAPENNSRNLIKKNGIIKIVWIANLKPLKRPEKFLEIVKKFKENHLLEFIMIGDDREKRYIRQIKMFSSYHNFKYLGKLPNLETNEILDQSHILINTSDYEGFSNTFVQAWLRKVVVLSLNSNPDNILHRQNIGYRTGDIHSTIQKLNQLILEPDRISSMGERARDYALKFHTTSKIYDQFPILS